MNARDADGSFVVDEDAETVVDEADYDVNELFGVGETNDVVHDDSPVSPCLWTLHDGSVQGHGETAGRPIEKRKAARLQRRSHVRALALVCIRVLIVLSPRVVCSFSRRLLQWTHATS